MKRIPPLLTLLILASPLAGAEVYRCEQGETTVYTDHPCDEAAVPLKLAGSLSVVPTAPGHAEIVTRNREYVDARRAEIAENRRTAARLRAEAAERERAARAQAHTVPVAPVQPVAYRGHDRPYRGYRHGQRHHRRPERGRRHDRDREDERRVVRHDFALRTVDD